MIRCPFCGQHNIAAFHLNDMYTYPDRKHLIVTDTNGEIMIQINKKWIPFVEARKNPLFSDLNNYEIDNGIMCLQCGIESPVRYWLLCYEQPESFNLEGHLCRCGGEMFLEQHDFRYLYWTCDTCGYVESDNKIDGGQ